MVLARNLTRQNHEHELADPDIPFEDGRDLSEDENATKARDKAAMRCAQSLEDTDGLEEEALFSDKVSGGFSRFNSRRSLPGDPLVASSNGFLAAESENDRASFVLPPWLSCGSQCGRCCGVPWQQQTSTKRKLVRNVEYVEDDEFPLPNKLWNSDSVKMPRQCSSKELTSASFVQDLLVSKLKERNSVGGDTASSVIQEMLVQEINRHATQVMEAVHHKQQLRQNR